MTKTNLLQPLFLAFFLIIFNVFVYTPHIIYFSQTEYFDNSFFDLVYSNFLIGLLISFILTFTLNLLPLKLLKFIVAILVTFSILMWLQSDYFAISYGVLDGSEINFHNFDYRGHVELLVVVVSLILTLIFHRAIIRNSTFVLSIVNMGLIGMVLFKVFTQSVAIENNSNQDREFSDYSMTKNVIIIILDNFGQEYFQKAIKDQPNLINNYNGFVSYTDAISNYSATTGSIPSLLTGQMLVKDRKYIPYLKTFVANNGLPKIFEQNGYEVSMISPNPKFRDIYPQRFMSHPEVDESTLLDHNSKKLLDYSIFRNSPHYFKPLVFNSGKWLVSENQSDVNKIPNTFSERGKIVLDYITNNAVLSDDRPRFKILHATLPHPEYVFNAKCQEQDFGKSKNFNYKMLEQSKCALKLLDKLITKYKTMGIYDKSLIVVTSDHGARIYNNPEQTGFPSDFELSASGIMFMVKGIGQNDPFKQVDQPFSLLKLSDALKNEKLHSSKYADMHDDNRLFYAYMPVHKSAQGYLQSGPLYHVDANYRMPKSWHLIEISTNNCIKRKLPIRMTFGKSNRTGYCGAFWFTQPNKKNGMWTKGNDNRVVFGLNLNSLQTEGEVDLTLNLIPRLYSKEYNLGMHIKLNGREVGEKVIQNKGEQSIEFKINKAYFVDGQNEIQILLPNVKSGKELNVNRSKKKLGVLIKSISLE